MKENNDSAVISENVRAVKDLNNEEKTKYILEFLSKISLNESKEILKKKAKYRFIIPLKKSNKKNVKKLYQINDKNLPKESINLLNQSYITIENVHKLLKSKSLVDSNTLIRSSFENLIMGMMIYLDDNVYEEFKMLGLKDEERVYTKQQKLRNMFKSNLKVIDKNMFEDFSNRNLQKMLDEYYDKLCLFTHSTLIVNEMVEVIINNDENLFLIIAKSNLYFLEILLNCCLKYITKDKSNDIKYEYMFISGITLINDIDKEKYTKDYLKKYNEMLYEDINKKYLNKSNNDLKLLQREINKIDELFKENPIELIAFFESLLQ